MNIKNVMIISLAIILMSFQTYPETKVLVLIDTQTGNALKLAKEIIKGIDSNPSTKAFLRRIPSNDDSKLSKVVKDIPTIAAEDMLEYDGFAIGSPVHFGNMSSSMNAFFEQTVSLWINRSLEGKPATVFMAAGSGAGKEVAIQSFWNTLAVHGMVIVPTGLMGTEHKDVSKPQGSNPFGAVSVTIDGRKEPSDTEKAMAIEQGKAIARISNALAVSTTAADKNEKQIIENNIDRILKAKNIALPKAPNPVGNYLTYVISNNMVYINQVAIKDGKIFNPGKLGATTTEKLAKEATYQTMLNILSVLKAVCEGDLDKVKRVVQLTGYFNAVDDFKKHSNIMNSASNLSVEVFGENGKHARAAVGVSSLPLNSVVEIQAIFELK